MSKDPVKKINESPASPAADRKSSDDLLKANQTLDALIRYSPLAIILTDVVSNVLVWNAAAERIFGWKETEVLGRKNPIVPDHKQQEYFALRDEVRRGNNYSSKVLQRRKKDGSTIHLNAASASLRDAGGEVIGLVGMFEDITERLQRDEALRESEARFRSAFENASVGASMIDLKGRFVKVNNRLCGMLGYSEEELLSRTFSDVTYPPDIKIGMDILAKLIAGEAERYSIEKRYIRKDGRVIHGIVSPSILRDKNGKATHCVGLWQDVTERKVAEESLLLFRNLLNHTDDGIFAADAATGRFLIANDKACENLGYDRDTLLTLRTLDIDTLFPDYPSWEAHVREVKNRGHLIVEGRHKRKDGTLFPVEVSVAYQSLAGKDYMVAVARDITERRQSLEGLKAVVRRAKEERAKSEAVISAIGDEMVILDPGYKVVYQNKIAVQNIGDHLGKICYQAFEHRDAVCEGCPVTLSFKDGQIHRGERVAVTDAGVLHLEITASPLVDASGTITAVIEMVKNVSDRKQAEDELRRHRERLVVLVEERTEELKSANESLKREIVERERMETELIKAQKLESLGILAGGIAHDFNNLLTTTIGNISLALLDLDPQHPAHRQLVAADRAMMRAQDLTQQLLTFSKGGAPVKKTLRLGELIEEAAGFALRGSRTRYDLALPDDLWLIDADAGQLSQVLHNLVLNADQAMPNGGVISIACENVALSAGDTPLLAPGRYVKITVRDNGIGIPKEHLQKIFDPYFTTKQRGSGLGLATTYSIVNKHGGHISAASEPGSGTTFTLLLPASSKAAEAKTNEEGTLKQSHGKILLMDDEEDVRRTTGDALARLGYSIAYAEDGSRAIELYQEAMRQGEPFNAVIVDLTVPGGMGGRETVEQLRKIDPNVKAIVSSGYSNDPVMADHRIYGFAGVVSKPYRLKQLGDMVYRVVVGNAEELSNDEGESVRAEH